jgi:hypothetical protein
LNNRLCNDCRYYLSLSFISGIIFFNCLDECFAFLERRK